MNARKTKEFHTAVKDNKLEKAKALWAEYPGIIDINAQFGDGLWFSPLHHAAENCNQDMVSFLLDAGADIDAKTYDGETALDLCKDPEEYARINNVLKTRAAFINAVRTGNIGYAAHLLKDKGAKINLGDRNGRTALYHAVTVPVPETISAEKKEKMVRFLLQNGANPDALTPDGTPLHNAAMRDDLPVMALLLDAGSHIEARNIHGNTPIFMAVGRGNMKTFAFLLSQGANSHARGGHNRTLLHRAAEKGQVAMMNHLMENFGMGKHLNAQDDEGRTPLYLAAQSKRMDALHFLLAQPGIRYLAGTDGQTPAGATSNPEVRALLEPLEKEFRDRLAANTRKAKRKTAPAPKPAGC